MRLMSGLMLAPVLAALVNARFEAYGYFYTFACRAKAMGGRGYPALYPIGLAR